MGYFLDYELFQECVNCGRTECNGNECRAESHRGKRSMEAPAYNHTRGDSALSTSWADVQCDPRAISDKEARILTLTARVAELEEIIRVLEKYTGNSRGSVGVEEREV